jgi:tryptophan-rich sensory protein
MRPLLFATAVCGLAVLGEALFMGKDGQKWMRSLRQPRFAPPILVWTLIGLGYYAICFFALYRLAARLKDEGALAFLPVALLLALMTANTCWNFVYFRRHDLRLAFWYSVGYVPLTVALVIALLRVDTTAAIGFIAYVAYLPYALWLFYKTWKLNVED